MIELAVAILLSGAACYLLAHYRAQRQYMQHTQQSVQQEASLQARLDALQEKLLALHQREHQQQQEISSLRQQLAESQQQTAAHWASRQEQSRQLEQLRVDMQQQVQQLQQQAAELMRLSGREQELQTQLQMERQQSAEKLTLLSEAREALGNQFKALASDILEEKSKNLPSRTSKISVPCWGRCMSGFKASASWCKTPTTRTQKND
jgi:DNA recombination protein RmuC